MDDESRRLKKEWKMRERETARTAFPLADAELDAMFDAVEKGVDAEGCDHTLRFTRRWLSGGGHPSEKVIEWLEDNGGFCDCEVAANARDHWEQNR